MDVLKVEKYEMFHLPKVENDHDDAISELLDKAGLVVIALLLLVSKHLLNIECVVRKDRTKGVQNQAWKKNIGSF